MGIPSILARPVTTMTCGRPRSRAPTGRAAAEWPDAPILTERGINALGYERLAAADVDGAIALFELNAELHPDSWNVWDSLAEAHMTAGDRQRAIELYRRSLEMNPENENAREKLGELGG